MKINKNIIIGVLGFMIIKVVSVISPTLAYAEKIELSLGHAAPSMFVYHIMAMKFKEMLEEKVGDKVTVKVYPSAQLGGEKDTIEGEIIGSVDMAIVTTALLSLWVPQMVYIDIPYLYRDIDHAMKVINGPIGQSINEKMEKHGVKILACADMGYESVFNSKRPIYKPSDIAGMKCRVVQNPLYVDLINAWGAKSIAMNFGEVYTALQQGVIDAAFNEPYSYDIVKHYEVAPYYSITNHMYQAYALTMSKKRFDSLSGDTQQAILDSAKALIPISVELTKNMDLRIIGKLVRENHILFNTADEDAFKKVSQPVIDKWSKTVGIDIIEQIKAVK
jgi:tripartite ATP-independent transporter DctP family solute receptor